MTDTAPRIVCVGANLESQVALSGLLDSGIDIVGVVTLPEFPTRRPSDCVDLHPVCKRAGITVIDTEDINSERTLSDLSALRPSHIFTLGWSQIFRPDLLRIPTEYVVGSHPSPLPEGRGRAPVPWTILEDVRRTAVTLFRMDPGVDSGPILVQRWFSVADNCYAVDLYRDVAENLRDAYVELYGQIVAGTVEEVEQDERHASYRARRRPEDGHLNFERSGAELERLVRAVSAPYPGAYTYLGSGIVRVFRAVVEHNPRYSGLPGQILARLGDEVLVQTGDGAMWIGDIRGEGVGSPPPDLRAGMRFGYRVEDEVYRLRRELDVLRVKLESLLQPGGKE